MEQKSPLLADPKQYKGRKLDIECNVMGSDTESETAIRKEFHSTTQTDVNSIPTRVGPETLKSDQIQDDFNSVCVKVETDEWCNTTVVFYSACAKSELVLWEETHQDSNKQDGFSLVHEQTEKNGYSEMDQDGFKMACVNSKQTGCDLMHQDVTRQSIFNTVCVNRKQTPDSNAYTSQNGLHPVFWETKQSVYLNTEQRYITRNDFSSVCGIEKHYINTHTVKDSTTANNHVKPANINSVFVKTELSNIQAFKTEANTLSTSPVQCLPISPSITSRLVTAASCKSTDAWCKRECCDISIKKDMPTNQSICLSNDVADSMDHKVAILTVNERDVSMPLISFNSMSNRSQNCYVSQSNNMPLLMSSQIEEVAMTSNLLNSNMVVESGECSDDDFEEIFIERNKGIVQPRDASGRENAVKRTLPLFLKPSEMKLDEKGHLVSVKRIKKANTPEKDQTETEYSLQQKNLASCMNMEPPDDDNLLYCGECNKAFEGDCLVHEPYNYIQDKEVPEGDPLRADHTLPDDLEIKTSKLFGASQPVLSPYSKGEELLVWYGDECARELDLTRDKNFLFRPKYVNGEEIYGCVYCKIAFTTAVPCVRHLRRMHVDKLTSNDLQVLDQWLRENYHNYLKTYSKHLNPTTINTKLNSISNVKHHTSVISQSVCDKQLTSVILQKKNNGEVCNYTSNISSHMMTNTRTENRLYKCEVCGYACSRSGHLKIHMRIHTGEREYHCEVCGYAFSRSYSLKIHMRIHTGERLFKCEVCGYACYTNGTLKTHMKIHTGEKLYKCEVCGYAFNQRSNLKIHMRIHTGEKPYTCEVCDYACKHSSALKKHMTIHTGEKLYKCEVCGFAFSQRSSLNTHMRIHTGEKLYTCEVCCYTCNRRGHLKTHMMIHTGEREYKCEVCDYACKQSRTLKRHMRIHTEERVQV